MNALPEGTTDRVGARLDKLVVEFEEVLERRLGEQRRWYYFARAVQVALILGLYFK